MSTALIQYEPRPQIHCSAEGSSEPCTVVIELKHGRSGAALTIALLTRLVEEQELGTVTKFAMGDHL